MCMARESVYRVKEVYMYIDHKWKMCTVTDGGCVEWCVCVCVVRVWSDVCVVRVMRTAAQETILYIVYI